MKPSRVSVVVVSFNTRDKLRECLTRIEPEHEVIVVDNASSDGSVEMVRAEFPHVRLLENSGNIGFGAANNQGMDLASRELVLLLNSDCYADPGAISKLAQVFADEVVAAGGRLLNPDGSLQESVAGKLTLIAVFLEQTYLEALLRPAGWGYWRTRAALTTYSSGRGVSLNRQPWQPKPVRVRQVMGACLMLRPVERFDERFFLYCEDTELCDRLAKYGEIVWWPEAVFTHDLGSSSAGASRWRSVARYNRGKELYFFIHHGSLSAAVCWLLNRLGALLRLGTYSTACLLTFGTRLRERVLLWWRVLTAPPKGPDRR